MGECIIKLPHHRLNVLMNRKELFSDPRVPSGGVSVVGSTESTSTQPGRGQRRDQRRRANTLCAENKNLVDLDEQPDPVDGGLTTEVVA